MRRRAFLCIGLICMLSALLGAVPGRSGLAAPGAAAPIRLKAATFVPTRGEAPLFPPGLMIAGYAEGQSGYYLIQLRGPVEQAGNDELARLGVELLEYVPEFAFKARMTPAQARRVQQLAHVAWIGFFHPGYKLSPVLKRDGVALYTLQLERGADAGSAMAAIRRTGAQILSHDGALVIVAADAAQLDSLAQVLDVAWVQNFQFHEKHNEYGAGEIMGSTIANANGYDGSSQVIAVADTGLGGGTASTAHSSLPATRVAAIHNWPGSSDQCWTISDDGAQDVDSGHGTHVAVSAAGGGSAGGLGKGTAPAARLIFQAVENWATMKTLCSAYPNGYYLTGLPADLASLFQQAYDGGARIHSNSWGSAVAGDYTTDSASADAFISSHPDMTITFSAGNEGTDSNDDGVIDVDSIGAPGTAKNVITIGASENDRRGNWPCDTGLSYSDNTGATCSSLGGQNSIFTWGSAWPSDYAAEPLASDPSAGNRQQMAAFSSRGPTDDGRIKPDLVAPGSWILSGYSALYRQGYDSQVNPRNSIWQYDGYGFPLNQDYKYMSGTSMSNPLAAGGAAVVYDFYSKAHRHNASAALVKATLINSAIDLLDENNDGVNDNDHPIPNIHEGWGLIDLINATDRSARFVDESVGLQTSNTHSYSFTLAPDRPFKVSLVWSDDPSSASASKNLVNDLDLELTAPNGSLYRGNVFSGGWSQPGGSADRINNVENVYVQTPAQGVWTVTVRGYNVPSGPQPFALVIDGHIEGNHRTYLPLLMR